MAHFAARISPYTATLLLALGTAPAARADTLPKATLDAVSASTFEVVVLKPTQDSITYERPLPLEKIPFAIRNDLYYSVGTAFALGPNRWVTAAHVFGLGHPSQQKVYRLRDRAGKVYDIGNIEKLSLRRDFVVFSIDGHPGAKPLRTSETPQINEKVYSVGNALGQGIVYRDGLFTSETPEERDGAWKWIRFSAAASPGNSGGPLLDRQGRVIGIVVRKSENENLNYALPIRELLRAKAGSAEIDTEVMYQIDNMANLSSSGRLKQDVTLPKPWKELDRELTALFERFGEKLKDDLFRREQANIFPAGANSAALLNSSYDAVMPGFVALGADGRWDAFFSKKTQTGDLGNNGHLTHGAFGSSVLLRLEKPDDVTLEALYGDSRRVMDLILRGAPLYRTIGGEEIRIVSMGKAVQESVHTDAWQRKWLVRHWNLEQSDQRVALFALPVPGGFVAMMRRVPTGQMEGHLVDLRALADFVYVSYYGTLEQWRELLAQKALLPAAFADIRIEFDYGKRFSYGSRRVAFAYGPQEMSITPQSDLKLQFSYFMDGGKPVWDVTQVVAGDSRNNSTFFAVARNAHPSAQLDDKFKNRWERIARRQHPYNRTAYVDDKRTLVGSVFASDLPADGLARAPLLYTAFYAVDGNPARDGVEAKLDVFLKKLNVSE